jgi:hypothetical protein
VEGPSVVSCLVLRALVILLLCGIRWWVVGGSEWGVRCGPSSRFLAGSGLINRSLFAVRASVACGPPASAQLLRALHGIRFFHRHPWFRFSRITYQ